jgi:hypothetical protein
LFEGSDGQFLRSAVGGYYISDQERAQEEIDGALAHFTKSKFFSGIRPCDLLATSKNLLPPIYLVEEDLKNSIQRDVLGDHYSESEQSELMEFVMSAYRDGAAF